jgi:hypothetical protein
MTGHPKHEVLTEYETTHWLDPGIPDCDAVHWIPWLTAGQLGLDRPKLTIRDLESAQAGDGAEVEL